MDDSSDSRRAAKHRFKLFVSGMSVKSGRAIENLRKICDEYLTDDYEIEIIDISRDKEQTILHQIVAIPTLIKTHPIPLRMILGDLSDKEKVLRILNISK
ncbi:circadian clock protein KaiB [Flavobacterium sp. 270]|uniref:circadian clock KaiB family protein n=1 Tax=Flavobacterium sp. 270 TaxID=2512114 RepID=UPI001065DC03|nr:circadian clock KaiB family protein [Flavobacterium sp. 270]TDW48777.1 circadian clock protein KaiB [Flavobacterium sp. 270]